MNKQELIAYMKGLLDDRMQVAWEAMEAAQDSANDQSKSSAGDKYETARSMGQLDRNMHARQYEQVRQERVLLERIGETETSSRGAVGALLETTAGWFFISVSLGAVKFDSQTVLAVSSSSPVGLSFLGKEAGAQFQFLNKPHKIIAIH
ncbi:transcription elongation factor [Dyadobacter diqingensis]|uniref:transcription elongation factor n=1 Tax=Dyadobacter diqingensis TaxID=2938121 RepID=UPI0020C1B129|nr:transcription elongation factor [Dyadobacter diqingensis]